MSERSPSGLWRLFAPAVSSPSSSSSPRPSAPSGSGSGRHPAVPASSGSGLHRATQPSRGLPSEPKGKAQMLLELAEGHCTKGEWNTAESHLRLALTFDPRDAVVQRRLKEVVDARDQQRRSANAPRR